MCDRLNRRKFIERAAAIGGAAGLSTVWAGEPKVVTGEPVKPIGTARGIYPGRVVWVHDPSITTWKGPGDGRWYEGDRTRQDRADAMVLRAVCELTNESTAAAAWDKLFRHFNKSRGKGDTAYQPGQKILIKPNWVGMIWREGAVDPDTYKLIKRQDYMNTSPQMIIAVMRQLVGSMGVRPRDITVCDSLAYLVHEYYDILKRDFPDSQYSDYAGRFDRIQVATSPVSLHWSCRPEGVSPDFLPGCIAETDYMINFASLKAHVATGVTLCGKNHFGSLVRWPVQAGYYDMHRASFAKKWGEYREQVDLMGHAHLGGKTMVYLIDGIYSGKHPIDPVPSRWASPPFSGNWTCSLLASQDPVAVDSVGLDFLQTEWDDFPRQPGVDDYLREAALAHDPPSGTFYDPNHAAPTERPASLGVHEHWNNAKEKKYSRNLGSGEGIELVSVDSRA